MVMFINCTPHAITIALPAWAGSNCYTLEPSGILPRCETVRREIGHPGPFRMVRQTTGEVIGLPVPVEGTMLVVSGMVLAALKGARPDVCAPDTGADAIREGGQIVAVRGFVV